LNYIILRKRFEGERLYVVFNIMSSINQSWLPGSYKVAVAVPELTGYRHDDIDEVPQPEYREKNKSYNYPHSGVTDDTQRKHSDARTDFSGVEPVDSQFPQKEREQSQRQSRL